MQDQIKYNYQKIKDIDSAIKANNRLIDRLEIDRKVKKAADLQREYRFGTVQGMANTVFNFCPQISKLLDDNKFLETEKKKLNAELDKICPKRQEEKTIREQQIAKKKAEYREIKYNQLVNSKEEAITESDFEELVKEFRSLYGHKNADSLLKECEEQYQALKSQRIEKEHIQMKNKERILNIRNKLAMILSLIISVALPVWLGPEVAGEGVLLGIAVGAFMGVVVSIIKIVTCLIGGKLFLGWADIKDCVNMFIIAYSVLSVAVFGILAVNLNIFYTVNFYFVCVIVGVVGLFILPNALLNGIMGRNWNMRVWCWI